MHAYYQTHAIGVLYLIGVLAWYFMEFIEWMRQSQWRQGTARLGSRAFWPVWAGAMAIATAMLFLAPHLAPGAAFGDNAAVFAAGMVLLVSGAALRGWSFAALGQYFTFSVKVSQDQPVIAAGPYRVLRHPGYAGGLLATIGLALMWGNWLSFATLTLLMLAIILWRIHIEERALLAGAGGRYGAYASGRKRLVPLVW
jgi:protein-S-isoprenylcysteine O-methyltransferase Ste14